jgi:hypothetical protein
MKPGGGLMRLPLADAQSPISSVLQAEPASRRRTSPLSPKRRPRSPAVVGAIPRLAAMRRYFEDSMTLSQVPTVCEAFEIWLGNVLSGSATSSK